MRSSSQLMQQGMVERSGPAPAVTPVAAPAPTVTQPVVRNGMVETVGTAYVPPPAPDFLEPAVTAGSSRSSAAAYYG